ncbi:MAG: NADH-quinone oxidoreductase subunit NuoG [Anaerolineales bacterium]|nr:NADH-quinone oxidoreductase subunit NuoG [Anaerolineales bacterium]
MSEELVRLTIDDIDVHVPKGTLVVDAAKHAGIDIPVFCHHPKLESVGMCRMCLVEVGTPKRDRSTGEYIPGEDGKPLIEFWPKLETSCTTPVSEGMVVRVSSDKAIEGRKQIVEYLLTSHPLDCPICDKGGECSLQDLTMAHGPGESRFLFEDKKRQDKNVRLGDLIILDRERCIQCARCIRYQEEVVDDPVLTFAERGRNLEIVTFSEPGFDSYFSGNTTDICPVGALTTVDFHFRARPWEMNAVASICPQCPVGCNIMLNTRRERLADGRQVIKRVMPRQNEKVNEIWICDKGRFAHHFATSDKRLTKPLVRTDGKLVETSWREALEHAAEGLKAAGEDVVGLASGRVSNEDLYSFHTLLKSIGGRAVLSDTQSGGELVQQVGVSQGTDLGALGAGDAILVIASDLHEEAPIWWQRVMGAAKRGATLVVANARKTRLDDYAVHNVRYRYQEAARTSLGLLHAITGAKDLSKFSGDEPLKSAAKALTEAENLVIFYGVEGLTYAESVSLSEACAAILVETRNVGRAQNGLIAVWPKSNTQGAWDMGLRPAKEGLENTLADAKAVYIMAVDPVGDDPSLAEIFERDRFLVVQELFMTPTAELADVVLPAASFVEREGTFTSGERRVQRFYPAVPTLGEAKADWRIITSLAAHIGIELESSSAAAVFLRITDSNEAYADLSYQSLAEVEEQWPPVGESDLYYGGTTFKNRQGLGVQLAPAAENDQSIKIKWSTPPEFKSKKGLLLVPVAELYDRGATVMPSEILHPRLASPQLRMSLKDAKNVGVVQGTPVELLIDGRTEELQAIAEEGVPEGVVLLGRGLGVPIAEPEYVEVRLKA